MNADVASSVAVLRRTPAALRALLSGLPSVWTASPEGPDSWSAFDVVGHLIDAEETNWIVRARLILAQGPDRRFTSFDRTRHLRRNRGRSLDELLARFETLRAGNLAELESWSLAPSQLSWTGQHPDFGAVTLGQLLAAWVVHDLGHLAQICRVMARQYHEAVGPWAAYLPVLRR